MTGPSGWGASAVPPGELAVAWWGARAIWKPGDVELDILHDRQSVTGEQGNVDTFIAHLNSGAFNAIKRGLPAKLIEGRHDGTNHFRGITAGCEVFAVSSYGYVHLSVRRAPEGTADTFTLPPVKKTRVNRRSPKNW